MAANGYGQAGVRVVGGRAFRRAMAAAGVDVVELKQVHQQVAGIVQGAQRAPVDTGALSGTVRTSGTKTAAVIRAGNNSRVRYGGPIHWGWTARRIVAQPWLTKAAQQTEPTWVALYERHVDDLLATIERSTSAP